MAVCGTVTAWNEYRKRKTKQKDKNGRDVFKETFESLSKGSGSTFLSKYFIGFTLLVVFA